MNLSKMEKTLMTTTIVALFAGIFIGYQFIAPLYYQYNVSDKIHEGGYFTVEVRLADGTLVLYEEFEPNLITDIGKKHARNLFASLNASIVNSENRTVSLSLSNDTTPAASWTKLPGELTANGLDRKGPTEVTIDPDYNGTAYTTEYTWTSTADNQDVQCVGVHWWSQDNSDNNLYAAGTFTATTLNTDDTIKITYTLNYG